MASKKKVKNEEVKKVNHIVADAKSASVAEKESASAADVSSISAAVERYGTVISNRLNVRKGPSKTADIVKVISKGDRVQIKKQVNEEWYEIIGGFVMKTFIDG